jgi:glycosyltransferase involved in cell wall biosynthesis
MKISVIVPVYNAAPYLRQCLESILAQTVGDIEVLTIDDGSTDGSAAICDEYAAMDSRVRATHVANAGVSAARNLGIDLARGEYVSFVDADDTLHPSAMSTLLALMSDDVDITVGGIVYGTVWRPDDTANTHTVSGLEATIRTLRQRGYDNAPCAKLYRRTLFDNGPRFAVGIRYEDLDFFRLIYPRARNIAYTSRSVYFYREHPASFINRWSPARLDTLTVTAEIERWAASQGCPRLLAAARDRRFSANFNILVLLAKHRDTPHRDSLLDETWHVICQRRREVMTSGEARIKNRLGALASYLGRQFVMAIARI